jgi:hypothetical protein
MKFQTQYEMFGHELEKGSGEILVERAGYVPLHKKVRQLVEAGRRLQEYREGYDFDDDNIDEDYYPETRRPGYDMADASMTQNSLDAEYKQKKREAVSKASEKAKTPEKGSHTTEAKPESPE